MIHAKGLIIKLAINSFILEGIPSRVFIISNWLGTVRYYV
jgi:hypothetical protein